MQRNEKPMLTPRCPQTRKDLRSNCESHTALRHSRDHLCKGGEAEFLLRPCNGQRLSIVSLLLRSAKLCIVQAVRLLTVMKPISDGRKADRGAGG